jgi:uncharacterized protein (DUF2147 family)
MMIRSLGKLALVLLSVSPSYASEAVYGTWVRGGHDDEKLEFYECEGQLCAKETELQPDGSPAIVILRQAAKIAPNQWKGDLFNPENSKIYSGAVMLDKPNQLTLKGCLIAFLCQSETWTRVVKASPSPDKTTPGADKTTPGAAKTAPSTTAKTTPGGAKTAPSSTAKTTPSAAKTAPSAAKPAPGADKTQPPADQEK